MSEPPLPCDELPDSEGNVSFNPDEYGDYGEEEVSDGIDTKSNQVSIIETQPIMPGRALTNLNEFVAFQAASMSET